MTPSEIAKWAKIKGIGLVGTSDWTHPLWLRELRASLEEAGQGVYCLRSTDYGLGKERNRVWFILSTELSCIYKQSGKLRKVHLLVLAPSFEVVEKINKELLKKGFNLTSDGRPIMGISAKGLTEIILGVDENCLIIPAHCWTPHFSVYGSIGGFDSIEECFGEYEKYIYAVETGLSSNPSMNWRVKDLAQRNVVSFSDAHSAAKMGREATVFELPEVSYKSVREALTGPVETSSRHPFIAYTVEFYPEEGKYHYTGHRNHNIRYSPEDVSKKGTACPVCGKELTVGVANRVEALAGETENVKRENDEYGVRWVCDPDNKRPPFVMLVPLLEILSEALEYGTSSKKVVNEYENITKHLGTEFDILLRTKTEEIERVSGPKVREALEKVRAGKIFIDPGYDGVFGIVKIWEDQGKKLAVSKDEQMGLF
ncbi:MAG: DNA helicase UvrD [Candidatus Blackburnbacteria bacterium]|nr:DNA helicase UvrD [Candidatus Blackburnbacteria bacterium]